MLATDFNADGKPDLGYLEDNARGVIYNTTAAIYVDVSGKVTTPDGRGLRNAMVSITDSQNVRRTATTSSFGIYAFDHVQAGKSYLIAVSSKRYRFASRSLLVNDNLANVDFAGVE